MIRNARDNAALILKEIATESKHLKTGEKLPDAPTTNPKVRIEYWNELYQRAISCGEFKVAMNIVAEIRKESLLCK